MTPRKPATPPHAAAKAAKQPQKPEKELVIVTGISGAGKASALRAFEDLGFHAVDNLPLELLPEFAALVGKSAEVQQAAIVVDVREGSTLDRLPEILKSVRKLLPTRVVFLDAQDAVLVRRYSETRRPHPLGRSETVSRSIVEERQLLDPIRNVADTLIDTSTFNVHQLRANILERFGHEEKSKQLLVSLPQLRVQERRAAGCGHGVRCAVPSQSSFCAGVSQADGAGSQGGRVCAQVSARRASFWTR